MLCRAWFSCGFLKTHSDKFAGILRWEQGEIISDGDVFAGKRAEPTCWRVLPSVGCLEMLEVCFCRFERDPVNAQV